MPGSIFGSSREAPWSAHAPFAVAPLRVLLDHVDEVDSTNDEAKRLAEAGAPEGTAVWAERQSHGRGRYEREWISAAGSNILMSVVLRPSLSADRFGLITMAGAVAVADAIEVVTGLRPEIKWPNDVLIRGRKVSGMLLESAHDAGAPGGPRHVILGIGINVNQQDFPAPLDDTATSLALETGGPVSREDFVEHLTNQFERHYDSLERDAGRSVHASFVGRLTGLGETINLHFPGGRPPVQGRVVHVEADGGLELEFPDGRRNVFYAGEVTLNPSG